MKKVFEDPSVTVVKFLNVGEQKLGPDELPIVPFPSGDDGNV